MVVQMDFEYAKQHAPLVLYLAAVTSLSYHLLPPIHLIPSSRSTTYFFILAIISLLLTWKYMFKFMFQSYEDARRAAGPFAEYTTTRWLRETSLFKQAWEYVCATSERWYLSSQLCIFTTTTWTTFLCAEGSRRPELRNRVWRYMILGQIVAISFASSLFLSLLRIPSQDLRAARSGRRTSGPSSRTPSYFTSPSYLLVLCTVLAMGTVFVTPSTIGKSSFLPNLLLMHIIIVVPLMALNTQSENTATATQLRQRRHSRLPSESVALAPQQAFLRELKSYSTLYTVIAVIALVLQIWNTLPLLSASKWSITKMGQLISDTIWIYPSQSSISLDVICTNFIWQTWAYTEIWRLSEHIKVQKTKQIALALFLVGLTPSFSAAVGISAFLALRERWLRGVRGVIKLD